VLVEKANLLRDFSDELKENREKIFKELELFDSANEASGLFEKLIRAEWQLRSATNTKKTSHGDVFKLRLRLHFLSPHAGSVEALEKSQNGPVLVALGKQTDKEPSECLVSSTTTTTRMPWS
jgi:hypothetical protein